MDVSVIIPTHDRPDMLKTAVLSVCNQTVPPKEIIIVDDNSETKIDKEMFSDIKTNIYIKIKNLNRSHGACVARNLGADIATGKILMFLDDDDTWEPKKIERQLELFRKDPEVGLVYSGRIFVYDDDRNKSVYKVYPKEEGYLYPKILYGNIIGTTSSVAIKKEIFNSVGGFDPNLPCLQDFDLWIRCLKITKVAHDGCCNVKYTINRNSRKQISGRSDNHVIAVDYLLKKYSNEMHREGFIGVRKIKSTLYFYVAKSKHRHSYLNSLIWSFKSLVQYPRIKVLALVLPPIVINKLRIIVSKFMKMREI